MNGEEDKTKELLSQLTDKGQGDALIEEVVRATFALLLKITGSVPKWVRAVKDGDEKTMKELDLLWSDASEMRSIVKKKQSTILESKRIENADNVLRAITKGIKDEIELLMKFRPVRTEICVHTKKKVQSITDAGEFTPEAIKRRLTRWEDLMSKTIQENSHPSISTIMNVLKDDITAAKLIVLLENYYLRAVVLHKVMSLMQQAFTGVYEKSIRVDTLAWIAFTLKRTDAGPWHYSQLTTMCGPVFQTALKTAFFGVIRQILEYISLADNAEELNCLIDSLKWNYTIKDHNNLVDCKAFSILQGKSKDEYISSMWGLPLDSDEHTSNFILNTFEYLVAKVVAQALAVNKVNTETSLNDTDEATIKLFNVILDTIFAEIKRAVDNYGTSGGLEAFLINDFIEISKEDKKKLKDIDYLIKDRNKISSCFKSKSKDTYSQEFCSRLLAVLYSLCVAVQENKQLQDTITQNNDLIQLIRLLQAGSIHQQFLVLRMIPLLTKGKLNQAAEEVLKDKMRFTKSAILDLLITFVMQRREGIWESELNTYKGVYSISKCAVSAAQSIIENNDDIKQAFWAILSVIMFGDKEDWESIPIECRNRRFIETVLSIAGGEANCLYKGAKVISQGKKGYSIVCFECAKGNDILDEWEFEYKKHHQALLHLEDSKDSLGEASLVKVNVSDLIPKQYTLNFSSFLKAEQLSQLLMKLITDPLPESLLLATTQVKAIKVIMLMLNQKKDLCEKVITSELASLLLGEALKKPKLTSHQSLVTLELLAEEMRKVASQTKGKTLEIPECSSIMARVLDSEILLSLQTGSVAIPLIAQRAVGKMRGKMLEYGEYSKDMNLRELSNKVIFVDEEFTGKVAELAKEAEILVVSLPLDTFPDIKTPIVQISKADIGKLKSYKEMLLGIHKFVQGNNLEKVIADYLNIETDKKINSTNIKAVIKEILGEKNLSKKTQESVQEESKVKLHPLRVFNQQSSKADKLINSKSEFKIQKEKEQLRDDFTSHYKPIYEKAEYATFDMYLSVLSDLRLFYIRRLTLNYLNSVRLPFRDMKIKAIINFLLISFIEADFLFYGFGYKGLVNKLKRLLKSVIDFNSLDEFTNWFLTGINTIHAMKGKTRNAFKFFAVSSEELTSIVYVPFLYKYLHLSLKLKPKQLLTYSRIGEVITNILIMLIFTENSYHKYQCILIIKEIICQAQAYQFEFSVQECNNILANKGMRALASHCRFSKSFNSILWKIMNEIVLHSSLLYATSHKRFGEQAITYCASDNEELSVNVEVIREFPSMKKLATYSWIRLFGKEAKIKQEVRIDTPKPLYDTEYCLLIHDPLVQSVTVNSKKESLFIGMVSFEKQLKANLCTLDEIEEKFEIDFNKFYLHFPVNGYQLFGFGSNEGGRLGLRDVKNVNEPKCISRIDANRIEAILSGGNHTIVIDEKNNVASTGKGDGRLGIETAAFNDYNRRGIAGLCATNQSASIIFDPEEEKLYVSGKNPDKMFSLTSSSCSEEAIKFTLTDIQQISMSSSHVLLLQGHKQLYGSPDSKKNLFGTWTESADSKFMPIKLDDNIVKVKKILALNCGSILLCTDAKTRRDELYSFGTQAPGLGQSTNASTAQYARLAYPEGLEFVDLFGCEYMAGAITKDRELYTWGKASKGALGLYTTDNMVIEEVNVPTKVILPENAVVISAAIGFSHMLVLAEDKVTKKRTIYGFGDNSRNQLGDKDVTVNKSVVKFFENKNPYLVAAGHNCSFVACGDKYRGIVHRGCICDCHKTEVSEILYLTKLADSKFTYYCKHYIEKLPEITMTTKNPIANIIQRPWPLLDSLKSKEADTSLVLECTSCKKKLDKGAIYQSAIKEVPGMICEECFLKTSSNFIPSIYYRIATASILITKELPILSLSDFYEVSNEYLSVIFTPKYKLAVPANAIGKQVKPSLEEFLAEASAFSVRNDLDLVDLLNESMTEDIDKCTLKNDVVLLYNKKASLAGFTEEAIRHRTKTLLKLNKIVQKFIQYINFDTKSDSTNDFYQYYARMKNYVMARTKDQWCKKLINNTLKVKGRTICTLNWHNTDNLAQNSIFVQLWNILKDRTVQFCKPQKKDKLPFKPKLKDQEETNMLSTFKMLIARVCEELGSGLLPLLVPTNNKRICLGDYREKWTLNPSATQSNDLSMLEFFGALLGMSFRLSHNMPLNLCSMFWKQLIGDPVNRQDFKRMDAYSVQCLYDIANIDKKGVDTSTFESFISTSFVTRLSDGSEQELKKNGKKIKVTFDNRYEYIELVEKYRLKESLEQIKAVRKGMFKIIPDSLVKLYSWRELEIKICGKSSFNLTSLKKKVKYIGCTEKDNHIQYLWKIIEQFTEEESLLYFRFISGRSRIVFYPDDVSPTICTKDCADPDVTLPEVHTQ